jgi:hypothetical protein
VKSGSAMYFLRLNLGESKVKKPEAGHRKRFLEAGKDKLSPVEWPGL